MPVEKYIQMDGEGLIDEELINIELVDMALEVVDLYTDPIPNIDDQPLPIINP
jgi:hypothetical protein